MIETFTIFRSGVKRKTESQVTENFSFLDCFLGWFYAERQFFFYVLRLLICGDRHHFPNLWLPLQLVYKLLNKGICKFLRKPVTPDQHGAIFKKYTEMMNQKVILCDQYRPGNFFHMVKCFGQRLGVEPVGTCLAYVA